jgi:NADH:ubiquinone oxidoreductase subunit H
LGGSSPFFKRSLGLIVLLIKITFLVFGFLWIRSSFPRIRYDQLMMLMWKKFLPLSIVLLIFYYFVLFKLNGIPPHYFK